MNELMRQAARVQRKIDKAKEELKQKEVVATAVGDKVKATVTYACKVARIEVDPEFFKSESLELVMDGIAAAVNSGLEQAEKAMDAELEKRGIKVPGI
jgi:DNA-binding YbaB/EbfC family protein